MIWYRAWRRKRAVKSKVQDNEKRTRIKYGVREARSKGRKGREVKEEGSS